MTVYMYSPEEHQHLIDVLNLASDVLANNGTGDERIESALSTLKAMKPVEPNMWKTKEKKNGWFIYEEGPNNPKFRYAGEWLPLYAKEQQ